jgi:hypothetical protein
MGYCVWVGCYPLQPHIRKRDEETKILECGELTWHSLGVLLADLEVVGKRV